MAQGDFSVDGHDFQVHAFATQGFAYSGGNNFLTMDTHDGSFAMTDGGVNISTQITSNFRVGAQVYSMNVGELGRWHPQLDWAYGDYKFNDYFGIRAGKVKTALGLYNDTQDQEFLYTWALLPQSIYPMDQRDMTIAHTGGDIYGHVGLHKAGGINYTAYTGFRPDNKYSGYYLSGASSGTPISSIGGSMFGGDARWTTPVNGLMIGASWAAMKFEVEGNLAYEYDIPIRVDSRPAQHLTSVYGEYQRGRFHFTGEYRRNDNVMSITGPGLSEHQDFGDQGFFLTAAMRITKRLEIGTYHSRYFVNSLSGAYDPNATHIYDQAITARYDFNRFFHVKVEGHFMDGYGDVYSAHGFYLDSNPNGMTAKTNLLIVRTGFSF
jgi:hypothetical protein